MRRLNKQETADKCGVSLSSLLKHVHKQKHTLALAGLPEPCLRQPILLWLDADIDAWLASQSTIAPTPVPEPAPQTPDQPIKRGRGRPRRWPA